MTEDLQEMQRLLAHHERQIQDLSDVVTAQRKDIDRLTARMEMMRAKIGDLETAALTSSGDTLSVAEQALLDKPPHY